MPNRRDFLKIGSVTAVASMLSGFSPAWSQNPTVSTRFDAATPEGKVMLAKLAKAVDAMVQKNKQDPLNWTSWWYTHAVRSDKTKAAEISDVFRGLPPTSLEIAERTWDTCQAHHAGDNEDMFLPWHRYFVYSFERVVRTVISDPTFTLPYWNYLNPASRAIPPEFRNQSDPVLKALFRPDRNSQVNQGSAIDAGLPVSPINLNDLRYNDYSSFCDSLDNFLHATVHVRVGNRRGMGNVPWAANDPVFWLHHCNIDRLWESWNKGGGQNLATQEFLNHKFAFVGPDSKLTEFKVSDCLNTSQLNYQYSTLEQRPTNRFSPSIATFTSAAAPKRVATDVQLGRVPTKVILKRSSASEAIATFTSALPAAQSIALVFKRLQTNVQPESLYDVFVNLPANVASAAKQRHFAGTINFFEAQNRPDNRRQFALDISELREIVKMRAEPTITIFPTDTPATGAKPIIGEISLAVMG